MTYQLPEGRALGLKCSSFSEGEELVYPGLWTWAWAQGQIDCAPHWKSAKTWAVVEYESASAIDTGDRVWIPSCKVILTGDKFDMADFIRLHDPKKMPLSFFEQRFGEEKQEIVVGAGGFVRVGDFGRAEAGDGGTAEAGDGGTAKAGKEGRARVACRGRAIAGDGGFALAGGDGTAIVGARGKAIAGDGGHAEVGDEGIAEAGDEGVVFVRLEGGNTQAKARVGAKGSIHVSWHDGHRWRTVVYYAGEEIAPNTFYQLTGSSKPAEV